MGEDLFNRITSQRGRWDRLITRIPGLRNSNEQYLNMSAQRDADRIIRDHIAEQLKQQVERMARIENDILDGGGLAFMSKTKRAKTRLQTLTDRIGTAAPGYAFSGPLRIREDELAQLLAFDEALIVYVDHITEKMDGLASAAGASEGINEAIAGLEDTVTEVGEAFSMRKNVLNRVGQGMPINDYSDLGALDDLAEDDPFSLGAQEGESVSGIDTDLT